MMQQPDHQELSRAMNGVRKIHMVGIGGSGMSGIATLLLNLGFQVSGSDRAESVMLQQLRDQGAEVFTGHHADHLSGVDVVVTSSAIGEENPEVMAARAADLPVIPRAEMLAELMRFRYGIAVAGTHGKTTTTSLIAVLLEEAGLDPTYVIGGRISRGVDASGAHSHSAQLGKGRYLVAEADESDASFLYLQPMVAVVTNIDEDHMSTYGGDLAQLDHAFEEFLHHLPFYGRAMLCADDPGVQRLMSRLARPVLRYGLSEGVDFWAERIRCRGGQSRFDLCRPGRPPLPITLNLPGQHNVLNALAAIAVASWLEVEDEVLVRALGQFQGIARRFQDYGVRQLPHGAVQVVDDYGHHPRELAATIAAARESWPERRLLLVFQPHRYSRTRDLYDDFVEVLSSVDQLLLLDIFAAGEAPVPGADGRSLVRSIRARGVIDPLFVRSVDELMGLIPELAQDGDLLLLSGAGDIGKAAPQLAQQWERRDSI